MLQRFVMPVGYLAAALVTLGLCTIAVAHRDLLDDPPSAPVGAALLAVAAAPSVLLVAPMARRTLLRSTWWRLMTFGCVSEWLGFAMRLLSPSGDDSLGVAGAAVSTLGLVGVVAAILRLESGRGRRDIADVLLDALVLAVAFLLLLGCLAVGPRWAGGDVPTLVVLDTGCAVAAAFVVALLLSAAFASPLGTGASLWSAAAMTAFTGGFVAAIRSPGGTPLVACLLWTLSAALVCLPLLAVRRVRRVRSDGAVVSRWTPYGTAAACVVPLGLYVWQAVTGAVGRVPDATWIGLALVLMCLVCMVRVARFVQRVDSQRHQLEDMARSDHLTGLANRRTADRALQRAFAAATLDDEPVAVALIDLDHFKAFNDRFGHHAGDELLISVAQAWGGCLGEGQTLARYGGEEFLVIASGLAPSGLGEVVDRMRRATPRGQSFSAGIASWDGEEDALHLVARADAAMYEAKESGRDRTCIAYSSSLLEGVP